MLSATGRKYLRGPRATGFLYVRRPWIERLEPPLLDLHAARLTGAYAFEIRRDARRFENWESFVAGKIGLGVAVDEALDWGLEAIRSRVTSLADYLRVQLADIPGVIVRDKGRTRCGIVTFTMAEETPAAFKARAHVAGVNCWTSPLEYTRFDMAERGLESVVRASVHYYNTLDEADRFCRMVAERPR
jgi:selenocysteine lyase/cysteine desulfurase